MPAKAYRVVVPRNNKTDALTAEVFFASLCGLEANHPVAFEIWGDALEIALLIRSDDPELLQHVVNMATATWPQAEIVPLDDEYDPVKYYLNTNGRAVAQAQCELRLREAPYIPLRTHNTREGRSSYDDFARHADPMVTLMGALGKLEQGEAGLFQIALKPIEDEWGKFWRGSSQEVQQRLKTLPNALLRTAVFILSVAGIGLGLILTLVLGVGLNAQNLILPGIGATAIGLFFFILYTRLPAPVEADIVIQKIRSPAFRARIRLFAWSSARDPEEVLGGMFRAMGVFSFPSGNGFIRKDLPEDESPFHIQVAVAGWQTKLGALSSMYFGRRQQPILSSSEVSDMWHLPHESAYVPKLNYTTSKRLHTNYRAFSDKNGIHVGEVSGLWPPTDVYIPERALNGHIGLIGATQSGKSNMMALLAHHIMTRKPDASLIVVDPHGTLAKSILLNVPPHRVDDCIYIDFGRVNRASVGFNILDQSRRYLDLDERFAKQLGAGVDQALNVLLDTSTPAGVFFDKHLSDSVQSMRQIWSESWGPRMEDYLRQSLVTLMAANQMLYREHRWERRCRQIAHVLNGHKDFLAESAERRQYQSIAPLLDRLKAHLQDVEAMDKPGSAIGTAAWKAVRRHLPALMEYVRSGAPPTEQTLLALTEVHAAISDYLAAMDDIVQRVGERDNALIHSDVQDMFAVVYAARTWSNLHASDDDDPQFRTAVRRSEPLQFTLLDVPALLTTVQFLRQVMALLPGNEHVFKRDWWKKNYIDLIYNQFAAWLNEAIRPAVTKINLFSELATCRRIFGQSRSTFSFEDAIENKKIVLINLAVGTIGNDTANLIGSTLLNWISAYMFARLGSSEVGSPQPPSRVYILVDEFQTLTGTDFSTFLSELSKFGANMIMGTQTLKNLEDRKRQQQIPFLENVRTLICFRVSANDASTLAKEFNLASGDSSHSVAESDFVGLPDYTCMIRTYNNEGKPFVLTVKTKKTPDGSPAVAEQVIAQSFDKHYRDVYAVDAEVADAKSFHVVQGAPELASSAGAGSKRGDGINMPRLPYQSGQKQRA